MKIHLVNYVGPEWSVVKEAYIDALRAKTRCDVLTPKLNRNDVYDSLSSYCVQTVVVADAKLITSRRRPAKQTLELPVTNGTLLPPVRTDLRDFEKAAAPSVDVLVLIDRYTAPTIGRYIHGLGEWQVPGWSGTPPVVLEWWPLPEKGTGHKINCQHDS